MSANGNSPNTSQRADEVRGVFRVMDDFMDATELLFARLYKSVSRSQRMIIRKERVQQWHSQSKAYKQRIRTQNQEVAQLTGVLASIDEGVILQNTQGRIILMNEAARELLGSVKNFWDSDLGQMFKEYVDLKPNPDVAGLIDPLSEPQRVTIDDHVLGARLAAVYSAEAELLGTVMVLSDVMQEDLGDKLKTSFITQMSHELLTPLTSIKGMSDLLLNLPEGKLPDRRFLETISRNVAIMDRMVVELLDISEIDAGNFSIKHDEVNVAQQVNHVVKGFAAQVRKAKVQLMIYVARNSRLKVSGDARRLQWAIGHLIDNAIKYTEAGGTIRVEFSVRNDNIILKVRDTGVGISQEDLPNIFDRFYRGQAWTPGGKLIDPRGLGQGLYVAKAVIEAHQGSLSVASNQGEGSTFTVRLPML